MKLVAAGKVVVVLNEDNYINYPMSSFINLKNNPDTQSVEFKALRILHKFMTANRIDFAERCVNENLLLNQHQARELKQLCWVPLEKIESCSNEFLRRLFKASSKATNPEEMIDRVTRNTAAQRANTIGRFISHYEAFFVPQLLRSKESLQSISDNVKAIKLIICNIKKSDKIHHGQIVSLTTSKFIQIIKTVLDSPQDIFKTEKGTISRNLTRDQCIFLLACEGLRPGAIASIELSQYDPRTGVINMSAGRSTKKAITKGPRSKGATSLTKSYAQPTLKVYGFTRETLSRYIKIEREMILNKFAKNKSQGLLFINEKGMQFASSTTVKDVFARAAISLEKMGILKIEDDPHMRSSKNKVRDSYRFYAYVLRHSAASFFLAKNGLSDATVSSMKPRFGWSRNSKQPERYAERAYIDISNTTLHMHMEELLELAENTRLKEKGNA